MSYQDFKLQFMNQQLARYVQDVFSCQGFPALHFFSLNFINVQLKSYIIYLGAMVQFTMNFYGVKIAVEASSYIDHYAGLPHMEPVGSFSFHEVDSGVSRGSSTRYYQDCDEIMLLASTEDQLYLAQTALEWLEQNNNGAWECMNWNTSQIGEPQDYERRRSQSEQQEQQQQESKQQSQEDSSVSHSNSQSSAQKSESKNFMRNIQQDDSNSKDNNSSFKKNPFNSKQEE